jgi:hypothetical protein
MLLAAWLPVEIARAVALVGASGHLFRHQAAYLSWREDNPLYIWGTGRIEFDCDNHIRQCHLLDFMAMKRRGNYLHGAGLYERSNRFPSVIRLYTLFWALAGRWNCL